MVVVLAGVVVVLAGIELLSSSEEACLATNVLYKSLFGAAFAVLCSLRILSYISDLWTGTFGDVHSGRGKCL